MAASSDPAFAAVAAGGVRIAVRLTPGARRTAILGPAPEADGGTVLKASVTAVPEQGKANAALIGLLAKEWRLPKSAFTVIAGATDRRKVLHVRGDPGTLIERIEAVTRRLA
ncbi:MAG TPA: DUF167 family protein [Alphaproteobacteria bacterium]|nr:DUF167 family protein [Alphaproteobacteria bacterium]